MQVVATATNYLVIYNTSEASLMTGNPLVRTVMQKVVPPKTCPPGSVVAVKIGPGGRVLSLAAKTRFPLAKTYPIIGGRTLLATQTGPGDHCFAYDST